MGPLRESSKEQKTQLEKEVSRSRIPRLVLRPQQKVSPASESPFSEEESREFNPPSSSGGSARTVSSNSFCSDDTGCPSSQSVSPVKTPSDAGNSPISFCNGSDGDFSRKKFSPGTMSEGNPQLARYKKETKTSLVKPGSEADFSSSSSTGSISAPEVHMSAAGSKRSSFSRKRSGRYNSCADNHSIKPQNPEQYLTPLQQKEVTVRHLKTKLKESESKLKERETEIEELKAQLGRMREDWIEEECNRVEAELALKEARSEIKQLKQVIETMKNSLAEKDKKIQKYFIDINIQNKKLESLLQSMEMAQNGSARDEQCLEYVCDSEGKPLALCATVPDSLIAEDQALEEVADSGLLLNEDTANGSDSSEESLTTTASELSDPALSSSAVNKGMLENVLDEKLTSSQEEEKRSNMMVEQSVQTDVVPYSLDVEQLIQNIFRAQDACPLSPPSSLKELGDSLGSFSDSGIIVDLTPSDPTSAILLSPMESPCRKVEHRVNGNRFMKELDFTEPHDDEAFGYVNTFSQAGIKRRYWSRSLLRDVLAVAAPVVPTIMWAFSTQRGGTDPIYNIGALLRGCCLVALHSLRRTPFNIKT
ncbi:syntabulin isoform X3 [Falco biarmicus]|uniref:syntabulin isoform X3 n=1 Tax=Falco rusticolus TaxID=120794 RepID=UPI001886A723|nr:syntabulin isoform X3 [Falco rusticolus]XP_055560614.1 syntabulin isoform X3 [Falco cherrug]XP_055655364.1 syntabulin isoform X3 [Falco peregrinus]XP_056187315.1 syntabulin isoform X3 [Falco biarmicus]